MGSETQSPRQVFLVAVLVEGGLVVAAIALGWLRGRPPRLFVEWHWEPVAWGMLATVPLLVLLVLSFRLPLRPLQRLTQLVDEHLIPPLAPLRIDQLAVIAILAGLGEELLFRGVVQDYLAGSLLGPWTGLFVASILFGLAHAISKEYAVFATAIGIYLGWLWLASDNLAVPIITHATYDFLALIYLTKIRHRRD